MKVNNCGSFEIINLFYCHVRIKRSFLRSSSQTLIIWVIESIHLDDLNEFFFNQSWQQSSFLYQRIRKKSQKCLMTIKTVLESKIWTNRTNKICSLSFGSITFRIWQFVRRWQSPSIKIIGKGIDHHEIYIEIFDALSINWIETVTVLRCEVLSFIRLRVVQFTFH